MYEMKIKQKNFKIEAIEQKYREMRSINITLNQRNKNLEDVCSKVRAGGDTLAELEAMINRAILKNKVLGGESQASTIDTLDQNYKLQMQVREL